MHRSERFVGFVIGCAGDWRLTFVKMYLEYIRRYSSSVWTATMCTTFMDGGFYWFVCCMSGSRVWLFSKTTYKSALDPYNTEG